jgi:hypothetical protein
MEILAAIENGGWAMFMKESTTSYVAVLAFHSIGMAFLVGISAAIVLRVLGVARSIPLAAMEGFLPLMYAGFWINALTGVILLALYPTKFLVDVVFYTKLAAIAIAVVVVRRLCAQLFGDEASLATAAGAERARKLSVTLLGVWLVAITAGRLTAYSLATRVQTAIAVIVVAGLFVLIWNFAGRRLGVTESSGPSV